MKRIVSVFATMLLAVSVLTLQAQKTLTPTVTLQLPEGDGSNSGAVVWHPVTKKYYTTMIGNAIYKMAIYDAKGKVIKDDIDAENDYRGLWYNPVTKRIEFNCYSEGGIGYLELDSKGMIKNRKVEREGMNQPQDQSVGVYFPAGSIIFLNAETHEVEKYSAKTGFSDGSLTTIRVGCKTAKEAEEMDSETEATRWEGRNINSVQYTGIPKGELAILNYDDRIIELYDKKTGLMSKTYFKVPESVIIQLSFNFSYNNGLWWFFNKEDRKWVGCK